MNRLASLAGLLVLVAGCGDDDGGATTDAGVDAAAAFEDAARADAGPIMCSTTADAALVLPTPDPAQDSCGATRVVDLDLFARHDGVALHYDGTLPASSRADIPTGVSNPSGKEVVHRLMLGGKVDLFVTSGGALDHSLCWSTSCAAGQAPPRGQCSRVGSGSLPIAHGELTVRGVGPGRLDLVVDAYDAAASVPGAAYSLDIRVRPVLALNAPCDPRARANRCDSNLSCHGAGAAARCAPATAPTLVKAAVVNENGIDWYTIDAMSADADVDRIRVEGLSATGVVQRTSEYDTNNAVGLAHFRSRPKGTASPLSPMYRIRLLSTSDLESVPATVTAQPMPIRAAAAVCDRFAVFDRCAAGHACEGPTGALDGTCVAGKTPSLTALAAYTLPDGSRRLVVDGVDDDGDQYMLELVFLDAGGNEVAIEPNQNGAAASSPSYAYLQHTEGASPFRSMRDIAAAAFVGVPLVTQVRVTVYDLLGLKSSTLTASFVPIPTRAAGDSCDTFGRGDLCQGSVPLLCAGTCQPLADLRAASCAAATPLSLGVPVTGQLPRQASRFGGNCGRPEAAEVIYTVDVPEQMDLEVSTLFEDTSLDTIVTIAPACDSLASGSVCHDSVSSNARQSVAVLRDAAPGRYYVFVDAWSQLYPNGGVGPFKVEARPRRLLSLGATCDAQGVANRCACNASCLGDPSFTAFVCR
ncbi:MAG: hypothetical protein IT370_18400 [Deltaproteobacteria bacterium]|nr:hypothetical protein [Deltaproteobacteria bacterium]